MREKLEHVLLAVWLAATIGFALSLASCGTTAPPSGPPPVVVTPPTGQPPVIVVAPPSSGNSAAIATGIQVAVDTGALIGFTEWDKSDPVKSRAAATFLVNNVDNQLIPWLTQNAQLKTSAEIQAFLSSGLYTGLDPLVQSGISLAAAVVDIYVPVPSSASLDATSVLYISAVLKGARDGANAYLNGVVADKSATTAQRALTKKAVWFAATK